MTASGNIRLPGSKSISNRFLLLAALSHGRTAIHDLLDSDDTRVMLTALQQLGCTVQTLDENCASITGLGGQLPSGAQGSLFLGNAGTAMRPLTAALALLGGNFELHGVQRMHERPIGDLVDALRQLGCRIDYLDSEGYPPLHIHPPALHAQWHKAPIRVRGDVSSQFLTALLLALPLVATEHDVCIEVVGELISRPYIEITLNLLARFGITVRQQGWQKFTIAAGSRYASPGEIHVEADASSASYFMALGAIASDASLGHAITIEGLGTHSIQGDIRFVEAARAMGAHIETGANHLRIQRGAWPLKTIDMDCNHIPDAAMTLAAMALYAEAPCTLRNIASWRVKETDRIVAMAHECRKLGATVEEGPDWIRIHPLPAGQWQAASIRTYDDHRIAMCFSLAAFNPDGLPVRILDPHCVAKTFPDYFESLFALGRTAHSHIPVICVDGPSASGKGTLAASVARALGYHYLDSGALYRAAAVAAQCAQLALTQANEAAIAKLARTLPVQFIEDRIALAGADITDAVRSEAGGMGASIVSAMPAVRAALVDLQHSFQRLPGLVADGRDMGTVIFPSAPLKVFLTASAERRAQRRYKQLISKGIQARMCDLRADLEARDLRDSSRSIAPLRPAEDALVLESSHMTVQQTLDQVLRWWQERRPFAPLASP